MQEEKEGQYPLWEPKERQYLLWVPLVDHYGELREDTWGNYDLWDFVNVHATYPL